MHLLSKIKQQVVSAVGVYLPEGRHSTISVVSEANLSSVE
jgi:hypothetical protein